MKYDISPFKPGDEADWDRFVRSYDNTTIFHTLEWRTILERTFGYTPEYITARDARGDLAAISPAFLVKTLTGRVIVSQPFFEYGGPAVSPGHEDSYGDLLSFYRTEASERKAKYAEFRALPATDEQHYIRNGFTKQFKAYGYYIDTKDKDFEKDIWYGLYTKKSRVRNSVKNAISSGVSVKEDNNVDMYYRLYIKTMEKLGSPPLPKALFENIKKYAGASTRFTFAYLQGEPVAAMMSFPFMKRDLMVGLVSNPEYKENHANDMLYNEQIEYATKNKFHVVDFGRTRPDSSYEQFKKKWGATRVDLNSYVYPETAGISVNPYKLYMLFSNVTKMVPWMLTRTGLGPYISGKFP